MMELIRCRTEERCEISVICPIMNEEDSVGQLLESLMQQTRSTDQIVFVDGGSTDGTYAIIQDYVDKGMPIELIISPGLRIAASQNLAVRKARFDVIASIHGGCIADSRWLDRLVGPIEEGEADVVVGWFKAFGRTALGEEIAELFQPKSQEFDVDETSVFVSRSLMFTRDAWRRAGGFPEWLTVAAEDGVFYKSLREAGARFAFVPNAFVYWNDVETLQALYRQQREYARGEIQAGLILSETVYKVRRLLIGLVTLTLSSLVRLWLPFLLILMAIVYVEMKIHRRFGVFSWHKPLAYGVAAFARLSGVVAGIYDIAVGRVERPLRWDRV